MPTIKMDKLVEDVTDIVELKIMDHIITNALAEYNEMSEQDFYDEILRWKDVGVEVTDIASLTSARLSAFVGSSGLEKMMELVTANIKRNVK